MIQKKIEGPFQASKQHYKELKNMIYYTIGILMIYAVMFNIYIKFAYLACTKINDNLDIQLLCQIMSYKTYCMYKFLIQLCLHATVVKTSKFKVTLHLNHCKVTCSSRVQVLVYTTIKYFNQIDTETVNI